MAIDARKTVRNLPLALMLVVFGVYLITMSGHTYSPDEETMLAASQSLIVNGSWALPPSRSLVEVAGADGRRYSQYGPGQSVAAVPWVVVGRLVGGLFPKDQSGFPLRLILASYNALIAAGICALLAALGMALGYSSRASLWTGAALAFATFLWPHSRTFFSEPLVALCLLGSCYLMLAASRLRGRWAIVLFGLSGVLFALAVATKVQYAVALPAFLLYLAILTARKVPQPPPLAPHKEEAENSKPTLGAAPKPPGMEDRVDPVPTSYSAFRIPHSALAWPAGLLLGLVPLFAYNLAIFGGALTTGYGADLKGTFRTPLYEGAIGLLLSPGKGLLWYALPLVLALWGLPRFARKHRAETAFVGMLFLVLVVFFGMYSFWPGDGSWGPRYVIPLLPFAMLPALETIEGAFGVGARKAGRIGLPVLGVVAVLALGFLVNLGGVLVNFDTYINVVNDDATRYWTLDASPILGHYNLLGQRTAEWATRLLPPPGTVLFRSGFSYSEGDKSKGEVLPRWTTGAGVLDIRPAEGTGPVKVMLQLADHRPPPLPRATVSILANGNPVQAYTNAIESRPASKEYTFDIPVERAEITIRSDTWNPSHMEKSGRNEDLGVMLEKVSISQGGTPRAYSLVESLPAPPYYPQPRWYYDPGTHHPSDLWLTYMWETGMGNKAMLALGLPLVAAALAGIWFGLRRLRAG